MRTRIAMLGALLVGAVLLPAAQPAGAAPNNPEATVVCDAATDTVTARISGGGFTFPSGSRVPVTVHFDVIAGSYVTATGQGKIPQVGSRVTAQGTIVGNTIDVVGYQRAWPSASHRFYTEKVQVTVYNRDTGALVVQREGSCVYDMRTTVTFTCDQTTHTIRLVVAGTGYRPAAPIRVVYSHKYEYQSRPNEPGFGTLFPDRYQPLGVAPDGTWSQTGFEGVVSDPPPAHLYHHFDIRVEEVTNGRPPLVVGGGADTCHYA